MTWRVCHAAPAPADTWGEDVLAALREARDQLMRAEKTNEREIVHMAGALLAIVRDPKPIDMYFLAARCIRLALKLGKEEKK